MKIENVIILSSIALGFLIWGMDALLDYLLFYEGTFIELLITNVPRHEVYIRVLILLFFTFFGFICSGVFVKQKKAEQQLTASLSFQQQLLETIPIPIFYKNDKYIFTGCNKSFEEFFGLNRQDIIGKSIHNITSEPLAELYHNKDAELMNNPGVLVYELEVDNDDNNVRHVVVHKATFTKPDGKTGGFIGAILDITQRKKAEKEKEKLITELQEALDKVKLLSGFLPICASCKKVRDDQGYWNQIESYVRDHSEVEFSHSICPECAQKLYSKYLGKNKKNNS